MHNGAKYTPAALEAIILGLKEKGYELVPISELIHKENYEMDHEGRQHVKEETDTHNTGSHQATDTITPETVPNASPSASRM